MKTLIVYATKNGGTAEIAQQIAAELGLNNTTLHNLKDKPPNPADFDCIIIGSSIYAAKIRKPAAIFIADNLGILYQKRVGLFLSGIKENQEYWQQNFPPRLLAHCKSGKFLGGIFNPKKAGLIDRLVMRTVGKIKAHHNSVDPAKITTFIQNLKS